MKIKQDRQTLIKPQSYFGAGSKIRNQLRSRETSCVKQYFLDLSPGGTIHSFIRCFLFHGLTS